MGIAGDINRRENLMKSERCIDEINQRNRPDCAFALFTPPSFKPGLTLCTRKRPEPSISSCQSTKIEGFHQNEHWEEDE